VTGKSQKSGLPPDHWPQFIIATYSNIAPPNIPAGKNSNRLERHRFSHRVLHHALAEVIQHWENRAAIQNGSSLQPWAITRTAVNDTPSTIQRFEVSGFAQFPVTNNSDKIFPLYMIGLQFKHHLN
jgi:hypothetical protein